VTPGDLAAIVGAVAALVALAGGYVQFVLRRSGLGQVEFDVELTNHHRGPTQLIVEIACVIKNLGSNMVIVTNVQIRARYRQVGDSETSKDGVEPALEHVIKPDVPQEDPERRLLRGDWFYLVRTRTFIQPGVTQRYRKPFALPAEARILHVWGAFDYQIEIKGLLTRALIALFAKPPRNLDWRKGIRAHTVRRTFTLAAPSGAGESGGAEPDRGG
jgi:hypothetical protein